MPPAAVRQPAASLLDRTIASLYPGSFHVVMATGIVSNGFVLLGMSTVATDRLSLAADYAPLQTVSRVMVGSPSPPGSRPASGCWTRSGGLPAPRSRLRPICRSFSRADAGTRTPDPIITSDVLYQLSYVGASWDGF